MSEQAPEMDEKILERIFKLLSLSKSTNEHEAQSAFRAAAALAEKYGSDIKTLKRKFVNEFTEKLVEKKAGTACKLLAPHIASFSGCESFTRGYDLFVWGEKNNVDLFMTIYSGIIDQINNAVVEMKLEDKYVYATNGEKKTYLAGFKNGMVQGIVSKLDELSPRGSILVPYKEVLAERFKSAYPNMKQSFIRFKRNEDGFIRGRALKITSEVTKK